MDSIAVLKENKRFEAGYIEYKGLNIEYMDALSLYYEIKDIFENEIYFFESSTKTPYIIDAGGCIGITTLYYKSIYPNAEITVFEPDLEVYKVLEKNINKNALSNVQLINSGVGLEEGEQVFYSDGADGGTLFTENDGSKACKVKIEKLSKYMNKKIDMLKINIEGAEGELFKEIESKLHLVDQIILEYHCFNNLPQNLGDILNTLDRCGFRYVVTDATNAKVPVPFRMKKGYKYFNLIYATRINI